MATDKAFFEWGQLVPDALAELAGLAPDAGYEFASTVIKRTERALDGILMPRREGAPVLFVEFQGYEEADFLWRWLHSLVLWRMQTGWSGPVRALAVYLQKKHQPAEILGWGTPGEELLAFHPRSLVLEETPVEQLESRPGPEWVPLFPLCRISRDQLPEKVPQWAEQLRQAPGLEPRRRKDLLLLLGAFTSHRLPGLGFDGLERLIGEDIVLDTPLGQMILEKGLEKGLEQGREQGLETGLKIGEAQLLLVLATEKFGQTPEWLQAWCTNQRKDNLEAAAKLLLQSRTEPSFRKKVEKLT